MHASCRCCQPTKLPPLLAVEHLLSISSAMVVRCWFTGEARDIKQNLRPCIRHHSSNYMESASSESQNSYLHSTVFQCSKDLSVHSWLISWLTPAPLTRYFHWWIMALYTNWMIDWFIDCLRCTWQFVTQDYVVLRFIITEYLSSEGWSVSDGACRPAAVRRSTPHATCWRRCCRTVTLWHRTMVVFVSVKFYY